MSLPATSPSAGVSGPACASPSHPQFHAQPRITSMPYATLLSCLLALLTLTPLYAADFHVSLAPGADDANPGTAAQPWASVAHAGQQAQAGDTVHIAPGIYRETLKIMHSGTKSAPITFMAEGDGEVLITGADVIDGFSVEGELWVRRPWSHVMKWYWGDESTYPETSNANAPFMSAARMENVFVDGLPLQWVPRKEDLAPGRFYWAGDAEGGAGELLIQPPAGYTDPAAVTIEVPLRSAVLSGAWGTFPRGIAELRSKGNGYSETYPQGDHIVLRGLSFGYTSEGYVTAGAMITGDHWTVEDCTFRYMNAGGLWIGGDYPIIRRSKFLYNGKLGFCSKFGMTGGLIEDCVVLHNNRKFYKIAWDAGGLKLHHTTDTVIRRLITGFNFGASLWFDIECERNTVEDSVSLGNDGLGLFYEVSDVGIFRNNVSFGNGVGLMYAHSARGLLEDNAFIGNNTGVILGGDRAEYKGVQTMVRHNLFLATRSKEIGWKWSKSPDGRSPKSGNMFMDNTFVTIPGGSVPTWENYSALPDLATFESEYANAVGNHAVDGLDALSASDRAVADSSMARVVAALRQVEPDAVPALAADAEVALRAVWRLGGSGGIDGYWLDAGGEPLLVLIAAKADTYALAGVGAGPITIWSFPHLGLHQKETVAGGRPVLSSESRGRFTLITGLSPDTCPLTNLLQVQVLKGSEATSRAVEGDALTIRLTATNILDSPLALTLQGPGLADGRAVQLAGGATQTIDLDWQADPTLASLIYSAESPIFARPLSAAASVHTVRLARPGDTITIDNARQRDERVWDERSGKTWEGPADLSAKVTLSEAEAGLVLGLSVTDNAVGAGANGVLSGDSFEVAFALPGGGSLRFPVAAPATDSWADLAIGGQRALVSNGDFSGELKGWYVPANAKATPIHDATDSYVRLTANSVIQRDIPVDPSWGRIRVSCRARFSDIVPGKKSWHRGRLNVDFKNEKGSHVGGYPDMIEFVGSQAEWKTETRDYDIPEGCTSVRLQAGTWEVRSGSLDIDDIVVQPIVDRAGGSLESVAADGIALTGRRTATGYEARVTVAWSRLGGARPEAGTRIAFNVGINDSDTPDSRDLQSRLYWQFSDRLDPMKESGAGLLEITNR